MNLPTSKLCKLLKSKTLPRDFYLQDTRVVARELLGKVLYFDSPQGPMAGVISETEAYLGVKDKACHSYNGRKTERVKPMYLVGGHSYVYRIYGMYWCLNVVTRGTDDPQAVLIRGVKPLIGEETMRQNRNHFRLSDGPGKLCQAFGLSREQNAWDFTKSKLRICEAVGAHKFKVLKTPRIGIDYAEEWVDKKLRYLGIAL